MKKIIIIIIVIIIIVFAIRFRVAKNYSNEIMRSTGNMNNNTVQKSEISNNSINENKVDEKMDKVYIKVNNQILDVDLERNSATKELKEKLKNGDIVIETHEYGGFEKVGNIGFSLPREDINITTSAGDIVLYQGNQISLFYKSNSWSYTKLGKIKNITEEELKKILGDGDVTITFILST